MLRLAPEIHAQLADALSRIYAPGCDLNCWEWAQGVLHITPEESRDHSGPYDSLLTFYVRRIMEFVTSPAEVEKELIVRKSAQLGVTLAYLIIICYLAATRPTHVLFGMDSAKEAKNISMRLKRLLTTNPTLSGVFTDEGADDLQNLLLRLRGMDVYLAGSGAAGAYANKSVGLVLLDELDKHIPAPGGHANTIDLARDRIKKVSQGKLIAGGTPRSYEGETNQNFRTGTREELHVPCPHCDHFQPFHWEQMRFEHCKDVNGAWDFSRVIAETFLECEACHQPIRDADKPRLIPRAVWVAHNKGEDDDKPFPGRVSIWISDLYSQDPQTSWGRLAVKWLDAQKSPSKLQNFFNETLGRPRKESKTETTRADLYKLAGGYEHGCVPVTPALNPVSGLAAIVVTSDVQSVEKKWVKLALSYSGEAWIVDYGRCLPYQSLSAIANEPVWIGMTAPPKEALEQIRDEALATSRDYFSLLRERYPDRIWHTASVGLIDEGHETFVVRDFCYSTADASGIPFFFPCKGVAHVNARDLVEEINEKFKTTDGQFITVYHFNDDAMKRELYLGRIGEFDAIKKGKSTMPRLWIPAYTDPEFIDELCQEKRALLMHRGKPTWMWVPPIKDNDWGDAVKMALALWHHIKPGFPAPEPPPA